MTLDLIVTAIDDSVPGIRGLTLEGAGGAPLPGYVPGSHVVIRVGGRANAYSLTGDGVEPAAYTVSVLRVDPATGGRGGSAAIHDSMRVGDALVADLPRSAFAPVARANRHLLVAAGIGITPVISHLRAAQRWRRETQVFYAFREGHGAHLDDLAQLAPRAELVATGRAAFMARLLEVLAAQSLGTHLYVCGPGPMIDATVELAAGLGWPASRVHVERFGLDALGPGDPFTVTLTGSGKSVDVPSGTSLLEALEVAGVGVPSLCRQGVCGECRIPLVGGRPLHRDLFLSDEERAAGDCLMACVSRADGPTLEVAL